MRVLCLGSVSAPTPARKRVGRVVTLCEEAKMMVCRAPGGLGCELLCLGSEGGSARAGGCQWWKVSQLAGVVQAACH